MTWDEHRARYTSLCAERPGLTVREYAEAHGLNPNTARRELKKKAGCVEKKPAAARDRKRDQSDDQLRDHPIDHASGVAGKKSAKTPKARASKGFEKTHAGAANRGAAKNSDDHKSGKKIMPPAPNGVDDSTLSHRPLPRGIGRRFERGNEHCIIHGRYAEPRDQDISAVIEEMEDPDFFETLDARLMAKSYAHLRLIERARNRSMDRLDEDRDGYKPDDGLHPDHKALQMLLNASAGISETAKAIAHMRTNMLKTRRDEETHLAKMDNLDIVAYAYEQQKQNPDLSYMEMAAMIETMGGKVPPFMMQQARIEAAAPPETDDETCTISPEELEKEAQAYRKMQANKDDFLRERRALVAQIVDDNNYGDMDEEGQGREGEFLGTDFEDDDELDPSATSDIYFEGDEA